MWLARFTCMDFSVHLSAKSGFRYLKFDFEDDPRAHMVNAKKPVVMGLIETFISKDIITVVRIHNRLDIASNSI